MKRIVFLLRAISTILVMLLMSAHYAHASTYSFTAVDYPGASNTILYGINDLGQMVGNTSYGGGFVYNGMSFTDIDYPGSYETEAYGVNNNGDIVGFVDFGFIMNGFLYNGTNYSDIYPSEADITSLYSVYAWSINDSGVIAGTCTTCGSQGKGFIYDSTTSTYSLFPYRIYDINNQGDVVGIYGGGSMYSFLYNGTTYTDIYYPGSTLTHALGVNDNGDVVGFYRLPDNSRHGFLYNGSTYITLDYPGSSETIINDINNNQDIVGTNLSGSGFYAARVVPEPISSILFVTGGTLFAGRMILRKRRRS